MAGENQPGANDVHVDRLLTMLSIMTKNESEDYVGFNLFPEVPVDEQSGIVPKYNYSDWLRDEAEFRAPGSVSVGSGWDVDNDTTFFCKNISFHKDTSYEQSRNAQAPYNNDNDAVMFCTDRILRKIDTTNVKTFMKDGVWGSDENITAVWSATNSTPIKDVITNQVKVQKKVVRKPNNLLIPLDAEAAAKQHSDVIDRFKHVQEGIITRQLLTRAFDVDRILVPGALKDSAQEGLTPQASLIWPSTEGLLWYTPNMPTLYRPSSGYTFCWKILGNETIYTRLLDLPETMSERVESHVYIDVKMTESKAGVRLKGLAV